MENGYGNWILEIRKNLCSTFYFLLLFSIFKQQFSSNFMRIVIIGGHLSPAFSVIENLSSDTKLLLIGRKHALEGDSAVSLEFKTAFERNINFKSITTGRLQRKLTKKTLSSFLKIPIGFFQSIIILKNFKPDLVLSFGGYVSLPVCFAAFILRIPIVIHEQTLEAGLSNKIVSLFAKKVCISWENSKNFFPKNKTILTGNPVRQFQISNFTLRFHSGQEYQISNEKVPIIYITGGSLGSHAINVLVEGCIEKLLKDYSVIHQTGDAREFRDFERLEKLRNNLNHDLKNKYFVKKFIKPEDVGSILHKASLVVARAGINTVTELIYFSKPSLLIPLPYAQSKEQLENANFLRKLGIGEFENQKDLTSEKLYQKIIYMIENLEKYKKEIKNIVVKDAAKNIIEVLNSCLK